MKRCQAIEQALQNFIIYIQSGKHMPSMELLELCGKGHAALELPKCCTPPRE